MKFSIVATGDSLLTQRLPRQDKSCLALKELFEQADIRFTNFELQVHDFEVAPSAVSGGTWVAARPGVIKDLKWLGLNLFAGATNHSLDWGHDGLKTTMRHLKENDCTYAGIGTNLAEASMPCYIDTPEGRVALISVCSSGKDWHIAGEQRPDVPGRAGINMLRFNLINYLPKEDIEVLRKIVDKTYVNARRLQLEREGFIKAEEGFAVGTNRFEVGEAGTKTFCNKKDLQRILRYISEAKRQADVVLVSHHAHEFRGIDKAVAADFTREFAHACIDAGVDAFLGHGPHILRGIEIYSGKPIFYSLGDFFIQNDSVERQPADFFDIYNLGPDNTPSDGWAARSKNGTSGLVVNRKVFESVITRFVVEDGTIKQVELLPITLGFEKTRSRKGRPELASISDGERILQDLQKLSDEFNTQITIKNGKGYIDIV
jgi:poly-gamma-glutamate capsule biosynthesis protein CapA/YwtB (metallophosphatase superfamily)